MTFKELYDSANSNYFQLSQDCETIKEALAELAKFLVANVKSRTNNIDVVINNDSLEITTPVGKVFSTLAFSCLNDHAISIVSFWNSYDARLDKSPVEIFRLTVDHEWKVRSGDGEGRVWETRHQRWLTNEAERFGYEILLHQLEQSSR